MKKFVLGDLKLLSMIMVLLCFGVGMVFSASYYGTLVDPQFNNDPYYYLKHGAVWAAIGIFVMIAVSFIDVDNYYRFARLGMLVSGLMLILLFTPLGVMRNGATRWIEIGPVTFMPGELAKIAAIFFTAWYYTKYESKTKQLVGGFLAPPLAVMAICFVLIYKQPNLSTALIICGIMLAMMFLSGTRILYFAVTILLGGIGIFTMLSGEHLRRITGYLDPFSDMQGEFYQTVQALLGLGAGGVLGTGPGGSVQKALYLPESQNDYIFAIIGEELGFVGCLVLLALYLALIGYCMMISVHATNRFSMLVGSGITIMLALQVILNIGVVTNLIPPTGVTLPFVSYGGNAMLLFMGSMGIMLNISKKNAMAKELPRTIKTRRKRKDASHEDWKRIRGDRQSER